MVGRDGMVGASAALDGKHSLYQAITQIPGRAFLCNVSLFETLVLNNRKLLSFVIRHEQTLYAQSQQSAACGLIHNVEERLCRWLLRARDLSQSDKLPFTQEYLAEMIGVRRASVSMVAHTLQRAGIIKYKRGNIEIVDVEALQESACECYGTVKSHYAALVGRAVND